MNATQQVSAADYRRAKFMINNISSFAPAKSPAALAIVRTAEKIIMLYHLQTKGIAPAKKIQNPQNLIGMHLQNATIFFAVHEQRRRTK